MLRALALGICLLGMVACSESSNPPVAPDPVAGSDPAADQPATDGFLSGKAIDYETNDPIAQLQAALLLDGQTIASTVTDALGAYEFDGLARSDGYSVELTADDFKPERYDNITLVAESTVTLEPVTLIGLANAGIGAAAGTVADATNGQGLENLTLAIREGINNQFGDILVQAVTGAEGLYQLEGLDFGNYTAEITGEGIQTAYATLRILGNRTVSDQNASVSPVLAGGEVRIVLSWGENPSDLDSHLTGPTVSNRVTDYFHVYFADKQAPNVELDLDDTNRFGPETITLSQQLEGVFRYSVFNYSRGSETELSTSSARVQVFREEGLAAEFFVPSGNGDLWTVFDMNGANISAINAITTETTDNDFLPLGTSY